MEYWEIMAEVISMAQPWFHRLRKMGVKRIYDDMNLLLHFYMNGVPDCRCQSRKNCIIPQTLRYHCLSQIQADIAHRPLTCNHNNNSRRVYRSIHEWKWFLIRCAAFEVLLYYACETMCCIYFYYTHGCVDVSSENPYEIRWNAVPPSLHITLQEPNEQNEKNNAKKWTTTTRCLAVKVK